MGSCLSKKSTSASPHSAGSDLDSPNQSKLNSETEKKAEGEIVKKEVHVIKNRMGTDEEKGRLDRKATCATASKEPNVSNNGITGNVMCAGGMGLSNGCNAVVRTSSCTKEEVDAILIQCGRLSRSSSTGKAALSGSGDDSGNPHRSRNYSGCKRSYDFEHEAVRGIGMEHKGEHGNVVYGDDDETDAATIHRHRQSQRQSQRQRQSRASSSPSHGRRRTPSREREQQQQQRSGNGSGGRRVSRSPGRRSEPPTTTINGVSDAAPSSANARCGGRPGKMVSVPATVTSFATDKSNNGGGGGAEPQPPATTIKRISLKRSSGDPGIGSRTAASPRSRSPARANARASTQNQDVHLNQHQQQPLSLSRSNSRKAEQSPCRRNPLTEINPNIIGFEKQTMPSNNILPQKQNTESVVSNKVIVQGTSNKNGTPKGASDMGIAVNCRAKEQQLAVEEAKAVRVVQPMNRDITVTAVASGDDNLEHQTIGRARSARQSRDLDFDPEALLSPPTSYTALLLEDIQSFHQMSTTTLSLPPCLTKACSILEAVADLNSSTSSIRSSTLAEERSRSLPAEQFKNSSKFGTNVVGNRRAETKEPFLESEVVVANDLMEPSLHKYVTMRGTVGAGDMEEQESSGSNSLVGGSYHWISSSLEPGSADSTDCWTTSRHSARDNNRSSLGF